HGAHSPNLLMGTLAVVMSKQVGLGPQRPGEPHRSEAAAPGDFWKEETSVGIQLAVQQRAPNQVDSGIIAVTALGLRLSQLPVMDPAKPARKARTSEPRPGVTDANSSYALLTRARGGDQQAMD